MHKIKRIRTVHRSDRQDFRHIVPEATAVVTTLCGKFVEETWVVSFANSLKHMGHGYVPCIRCVKAYVHNEKVTKNEGFKAKSKANQ